MPLLTVSRQYCFPPKDINIAAGFDGEICAICRYVAPLYGKDSSTDGTVCTRYVQRTTTPSTADISEMQWRCCTSPIKCLADSWNAQRDSCLPWNLVQVYHEKCQSSLERANFGRAWYFIWRFASWYCASLQQIQGRYLKPLENKRGKVFWEGHGNGRTNGRMAGRMKRRQCTSATMAVEGDLCGCMDVFI